MDCTRIRIAFLGVVLAAASAASELDREIVLAPQAGADREDGAIRREQERAGRAGAAAADYERLGWAFVAKARRTLDAGYYKLAEKTADAMEAEFGRTTESQALRGEVLRNLHHFREAEVVARALVADRGAPADLALLSDALMEQGDLMGAAAALQRMVNLRPGIEADARIAHLRWLKGDLTGARVAMEGAARAVSPQDGEPYAWTLARLSGYYLQAGQTARALVLADAANRGVPDFPSALLARGRALLALRERDAAIGALECAVRLNPLPEYQWWLADALRSAGREQEAAAVETEIIAHGETADPRTFALFLATRGIELRRAQRLARAELETRGDVFTHDALAWTLFAAGEFDAARTESDLALAENTPDARLLLHAAEIARARGEASRADKFFETARRYGATLTPSESALIDAPVIVALRVSAGMD